MVRLKCPACGHGLKVKEEHAGKRGRCPMCSQVIQIPCPPETDEGPVLPEGEVPLKERPPDAPKAEAPSPAWGVLEPEVPQPSAPKGLRRYPLVLDVFLYPASRDGLLTLGVLGGLMLAAHVLMHFPLPLMGLASLFGTVLVIGYLACYLVECVRSSADGNTRAPGILLGSYDFQDALLQVGDLLAAFAGFCIPAGAYALIRWRIDPIFWTLAGIAAFCLPMGLLSVLLWDATSALSPTYWAPPIVAVLLPYLGLLAILAAIGGVTAVMVRLLGWTVVGVLCSSVLTLYVAMICAHVMGRFYFRYEKKIGWEI